MNPGQKSLFAGALLFVSYVISGKAATMLAVPPGYASAIFPPAGIAIAAAFISGGKALPWVFLGSIALNLWIGHAHAGSVGAIELEAALMIATASTAQAALGGWILRRKIGYPAAFDQARQIAGFLLWGPVICLTSASLSVGGLEWIGMFDGLNVATNWFSWWAGDTLGLLVMLPIVMSIAGEPGSLWKKRRATVSLPMLIVLSLMVFTFIEAKEWEESGLLADFREVSQQSVERVRMGLEEQGALLTLLHGFFEHDQGGTISRLEFQRFCEDTTRKFPMIRAMEWVPRIPEQERDGFEKVQAKELPGYEIRKHNEDGTLEREGSRAWYYPVTYIVPMKGNEKAMGVDLLSMPRREKAVEMANMSGKVVATEPIRLVQGGEGLLILQSVKMKGKIAGLVLIVLKMQDFMDRILPASSKDLDMLLLDAGSRSVLYPGSQSRHFDALYSSAFGFGSRQYVLLTAPNEKYYRVHRGWQSWWVLAMGAFGTSLLGALLLLGTGYTARVVAQVNEKTRELQDSEARLNRAQHSAHVGNWELDLLNGALYWSDEIYRMFEIDPSGFEASYEAFLNAVHPEDRKLVNDAYTNSLVTRRPYDIVHRLRFPDGRIKYVHERCETRFDENGKPLASLGTVQDITARQIAENALRESEFRFRFMLENSPIAVRITNAEACEVVFANQRYASLLDLERDEILGLNPKKYYVNQGDYAEVLDRLEKGERVIDKLVELAISEQKRKWVLASYLKIEWAGKSAILGWFYDISDRMNAEEQVRNSAKEIEDLYEHAPCGYHSLDRNGLFVRVNQTVLNWLEYRREELIGKSFEFILTPSGARQFREAMPRFLVEGSADNLEYEFVRKDGTRLSVLLSASAVHDEQGGFVMSRSTTFDLTERKKLERLLEEQAHTDSLTGLNNRRHFYELAERELSRSRRFGPPLSLLMLDIDHFKQFNDRYGHDAGDLVLTTMAKGCLSTLRDIDIVGRLGGEEFAVLLPGIDGRSAQEVAERLRVALSGFEVEYGATEKLNFTVSIGTSTLADHSDSIDAMIKRADNALYSAKTAGRNCVRQAVNPPGF